MNTKASGSSLMMGAYHYGCINDVYMLSASSGEKVQEEHGIICPVSGTVLVSLNDITHRLLCGQFCLIMPGDRVSITMLPRASACFCSFSLDESFYTLQDYTWYASMFKNIAATRTGMQSSDLLQVFKNLLKEWNNDADYREETESLLFQHLLICCYRCMKAQHGVHTDADERQQILDAVVNSLKMNFGTDNLGRNLENELGYSYSFLARLVRQEYRETIYQLYTRLRLEKARSLLGILSVSETAQQCGFRSLASFSKAFTRYMGISPTTFIKMEASMTHPAVPSDKILQWQDLELGVLIHYVLDIYNPNCHQKQKIIAEEIPPSSVNPSRLDPEQWVRAAYEMGAKYAILVAKHGTGFALWPTDVNDFSCKSMPWKNGKGDIVGEFIAACKKYGLLPGLYYHPTCNGYYGIDNGIQYDYKGEMYQSYVRCVERQIEELWSRYGELFEIWFDGGTIPPEEGGPDLVPLLKKYQPNAVCFQGPKDWPHNLRWVGNEDGLAPPDCWATTNAGETRFDGSATDEQIGVGDPDGIYYRPAETDMPNRNHHAFGGGWGWSAGEETHVFSPEYLLDCYVRSVGRNSNLLIGMAISTDGDFQDEDQFVRFGQLLKKTFGSPAVLLEKPSLENDRIVMESDGKTPMDYLSIREDIRSGQHIRKFHVLADGRKVSDGRCIGHRRIIPLEGLSFRRLEFIVDETVGEYALRDIALYRHEAD